jgi:RHS repeat-associated protein
VSQKSYDALGRVTQTIADYTNGTPTASTNQTTNYTYNGVGDVLTVQAVMPAGTPSQTTQYVYGVTVTGGSGINSNDLLAKLEYPDPTTGNPSTSASNQKAYQYNRLGDATTYTDPNGSVHTYSDDVLGRITADAVTTLGSGVDGAIRRLTLAYDTGDRPYLYTSYNASSGGSIVNQVQDAYNGLGQLIGEYQEQGGAVNTSTSPEVQYVYTEMSGGQNNSRPTQMIYPNGRKLDYVYNSGLDSSISRLSALADDNNGNPGTTLQGYSYLGLDTIVQRAHPEDGVNLTYIQQTGDTHYLTDGGDRYVGLDRFGRVIDQNWWKPTSQSATDRFQYGYDRTDDVLYSNNLVSAAQSELYRANSTQSGDSNTAYDPLNRQVAFARGTLSSSGHNGTQLDTIASSSRSQSWSLDALGNWSSVTTNGSATTRTFNAQNQTATVSPGTAPTYDHNGNTTGDAGLTFVYDAWNRLVTAKNGATTVASYAYDALGRRVIETYSGTSTTNHVYYSPQWQVIEERQNGTGTSNVSYQYAWGAGYVDDLVLRDTYSGGVKTLRLYAQQNANYDTTALVNTSGQVQERYLYDPYGAVTICDANWTPRTGNTSSYGWQYLHQGGRLDGVTGWYSFRNRDLIPAEGRWAERDPLGLGGGDLNIYRYVFNSPAGFTDPRDLGLGSLILTGIWSPPPNVWDSAWEGLGHGYLRAYNDSAPEASYILATASFAPGPAGWLSSGLNVVLASPLLNPYDPDPNQPLWAVAPNPKGPPIVIIGRPVPQGPLGPGGFGRPIPIPEVAPPPVCPPPTAAPKTSVPPIRTGKWGPGSHASAVDSLKAHFRKHGREVGASDPDQYLRKAEGFAQNLRGATKSPAEGPTPGVTRYKKLGKFIDLDADGNIISFGSQ